MDIKHYSWIFAIIALLTHIFGLIHFLALIIGVLFFVIGCLTVIYVQRGDLEQFLSGSKLRNPLEAPRTLGLNLVCDQKPIVLITPNIKIQTESKKHKSPQHHSQLSNTNQQQQHPHQNHHHILQQQQKQHNNHHHHLLHHNNSTHSMESRKKSLIDSGIELLFKKHGKHIKDGHLKMHDVYLDSKNSNRHASSNRRSSHGGTSTSSNGTGSSGGSEEKRWKPFENIKIYTDKKKSLSPGHDKIDGEHIQYGEDCSGGSSNKYQVTISSDAHLLDDNGSPKKKQRTMLSGYKQIDQLLHTIIDYIIRDFIDSWFCSLSDNKEFSDFRVRNCIEECVSNVCNRTKNTQWVPLMTTKLIDNIANHTRIYRLAHQSINNENLSQAKASDKVSPQRKCKKTQHKRNKSDTDLEWYFGANSNQKNVTNSKFYNTEPPEEKNLADPETNLLNAFFNQSDLYKKECMDERELEKYLTHVMETILYFTLPEEDFACIPLRTFLSTLLANVILKPILEMISDPDFINLQVAKLFSREPPPVEYFIKALRQSTDLSELRACRQLITKEMNLKYKDPTASAELASLKYSQKLIDLRINYLQNTKDFQTLEKDKVAMKLPILPLDELLFKELARSYFLDYLSVLNLQKYVIFYLTADEWKMITNQALTDMQSNKAKGSKDELYRSIRDKGQNIFKEYLVPSSQNYLDLDQGLIEALSIKLRDPQLLPEPGWFDSICKFVYEKLKNEEVFLTKFYQSSAYRKLLLELEFVGQNHESDIEMNLGHLHASSETGSDTNSGDLNFDDDLDSDTCHPLAERKFCESSLPLKNDFLDVTGFKHARSHSDCTGIIPSLTDLNLDSKSLPPLEIESAAAISGITHPSQPLQPHANGSLKLHSDLHSPKKDSTSERAQSVPPAPLPPPEITFDLKQKLLAKIINTAILCEGQYAVYAIQVIIVEDNQQKSWHIYRRYSKFLELKKLLTKKYPIVAKIPFPAKKAFQNTQRSVLEHRMVLLNEFLRILCVKAEDNEDMMRTIREFLEPDTDDRKIHGGAVIRTIETLVNPFKTGMRTIRNMPDTLVGGFSKILLGKGPLKEPSFLEVNSIYLEQSSEYPALTSALHLLDEVFDLQARSQWLRRGIINRLLGAPWVSHTANKKIIHGAKSLIEVDKIEHLLTTVLNSVWPDGKKTKRSTPREDNTKLRTRVAAKMALFALLSDDLKHVVGSETTRSGLLNIFSMWQHKKLNLRLALVLLNDILTTLYRVDSMTKHVND